MEGGIKGYQRCCCNQNCKIQSGRNFGIKFVENIDLDTLMMKHVQVHTFSKYQLSTEIRALEDKNRKVKTVLSIQ